MNRLIRRFDAVKDGDLCVCAHRGVAYQRDMTKTMTYGVEYFEYYRSLAGSPIEQKLNAGRVGMLRKHAGEAGAVLDIGVGSGAFVSAARASGFETKGFDINPAAVSWLQGSGLYSDDVGAFDVVTCWDSLEHMPEPEVVLKRVRRDGILLLAIPIFENLGQVRASKHFKPSEHFYYFTEQGLVDWLAFYGFRLLERSTHETDAGREAIGAFAFRRDLPDYRDYIGLYSQMHAARHYGSSATELHLERAAAVVKACAPRSILDYGCGRSDLVAHFWRDGERTIARYDPAIPAFKRMPEERFDLVFCCDVMEHIPMASVDRVLGEIRERSDRAFFTISTKLARAKLPDGSNAHCTILTRSEWVRWIGAYFGPFHEFPARSEHELVLFAGDAAEAMKEAARRCRCGGEVVVDYFDPVRRPVEWFMRCTNCGDLSPPSTTRDEALRAWDAGAGVIAA